MKIYIVGDITEDMVRRVVLQIEQEYKSGETIELFYDSPGGYTECGYALYEILEELKSYGSKLLARNVGDVMSAATIPWLVCDERIWDPKYRFIIHNPYVENISGDANEILENAVMLTDTENDLIEFYASGSGLSTDEIISIMNASLPISSEKMLEYSFATSLI